MAGGRTGRPGGTPTPLTPVCLSCLPPPVPCVCPSLSAGLAPPWTVAASPTFSSPRPPCRLSGPPVIGPGPDLPPLPSQPTPPLCTSPCPPSSVRSLTSQSPECTPLMKNLAKTSQPDVPATCLLGREGLRRVGEVLGSKMDRIQGSEALGPGCTAQPAPARDLRAERQGDWRWPGTDGAGAGTRGGADQAQVDKWTGTAWAGDVETRPSLPEPWERGQPAQKWTLKAGDVDSKTGLDVHLSPSHTLHRWAVCVCVCMCVRT